MSITGPVIFEEYYVIENLKKQVENGVDLKKGQVVEVIEKNPTGWWLVAADEEHGWAPASYLSNDKQSSNTTIEYEHGHGEIYVSTKKYEAVEHDELSFDVGVHFQILEKHQHGWWRTMYLGREGMVPCTHLKPIGQINKEVSFPGDALLTNRNDPEKKDKTQVSNQDNNVVQMVRKESRFHWSNSVNEDALDKLHHSVLSIPEEERNEITKETVSVDRKVHCDLQTEDEVGWVPGDISPRCITKRDGKLKPQNKYLQQEESPFPPPIVSDTKDLRAALSSPSSDSVEHKIPDESQNSQQTQELYETSENSLRMQILNQETSRNSASPDLALISKYGVFGKKRYRTEEKASKDKDITQTPCALNDTFSTCRNSVQLSNFEDSESEDDFVSSSESGISFEDSSIDKDEEVGQMYVAIAKYKGSEAGGEIDLSADEVVRVLEKTRGGWWLVEGRQGSGWAPSNFLQETPDLYEP